MIKPRLLAGAFLGAGLLAATVVADPLSKKFDIDFYRDVPSRDLTGLAARSDGRLVAGPTLTRLEGELPADLIWALEPAAGGKYLAGTGPEGRILEIDTSVSPGGFVSRILADLDDTQVTALRALPDGRIVAGTSPTGRIYLLAADGTLLSQVTLPVDSVLDIAPAPNGGVFVATGNPGRLYRIDLAAFAAAGLNPERAADEAALQALGAHQIAEIRDRNIRRVVPVGDRLILGSAPRGNLYVLPADPEVGSAPVILQENRDAEVTDILPMPDGEFFAAVVFSGTSADARVSSRPPASPDDRFGGRSSLIRFPVDGFPETVAARSGIAFYRLARRGDLILVAGGDRGELLGYSISDRRSMTFGGSDASQLNGLVAEPGGTSYLLAGNNAPQLARLDFSAQGPRTAETRRLDLGSPARVGLLRFNRTRGLDPASVGVEMRISQGTDELEGWTDWAEAVPRDGAWQAPLPPGRYVRLRIEVPAGTPADFQLDRAALYHLPQNRRPQLQDFRIIAPNYGLIPRGEQQAAPTTTLAQILGINRPTGPNDDQRPPNVLASLIVPQPGAQIVYWNATDPDGDALTATFSVRASESEPWSDLAVQVKDPYVQFDFSHLPDGVYFTRLVIAEQAPRPETDRLVATFETDDLVIDKTPPEILAASAARGGDRVQVAVRGRDAGSLLAGIELVFNNGYKLTVEQPADGILDGREEEFRADIPGTSAAGATSVEVLLYDALGNSSGRRLSL